MNLKGELKKLRPRDGQVPIVRITRSRTTPLTERLRDVASQCHYLSASYNKGAIEPEAWRELADLLDEAHAALLDNAVTEGQASTLFEAARMIEEVGDEIRVAHHA